MITINNLNKRYRTSQDALTNINFNLDSGEMAFLTGHSGAGKSTLLKIIALIEKPTSGQIVVNEQNYHQVKMKEIPYLRRNIGLIFQAPHLLNDRTVFDNVALPLVISGLRLQDIQRRVRAALDKVGLLNKERMIPTTLSGGEQQRVGIARAIVNKPALLLADEPTGNLDPDLSLEIMRLFEQFNQVGVSVVIATHDLALISKLPYRQVMLKDGRIA